MGSAFYVFYDVATFWFFRLFTTCIKDISMKRIDTGKGYITLWALAGIWSVSALTSLPGLAVSPISEKLLTVFPGATELDIQMLTTLPSLLVIPLILIAGYISEKVGYIRLLYSGLVLFLLSGALYFFCGDIKQLIIVSAMLGIGAGMIIPLSTALVSKFFKGEERTRQYGYVSAITNITLVVATALTGWLADIQWRLPFLVYLLPLFSIILVPAIRRGEKSVACDDEEGDGGLDRGTIEYGALSEYMIYYLLITCLVMAVDINLPFLLGGYGYDSATSGVVIALFFLAMMLPGLFLNRILAVVKGRVLTISLLLIMLGLADIFLNTSLLFVVVGCVVAGVGYGIAQPYIYDRTASLASGKRVTYALALVMTMNYVAIVIAPFVTEYLQKYVGLKGNAAPFLINAVIAAVALAYMLLRRWFVKR